MADNLNTMAKNAAHAVIELRRPASSGPCSTASTPASAPDQPAGANHHRADADLHCRVARVQAPHDRGRRTPDQVSKQPRRGLQVRGPGGLHHRRRRRREAVQGISSATFRHARQHHEGRRQRWRGCAGQSGVGVCGAPPHHGDARGAEGFDQHFQAVNAIAKLLAGTLGAVIQAVLPLLAALAPVVTELAKKLGPVLADPGVGAGRGADADHGRAAAGGGGHRRHHRRPGARRCCRC
jgi:hypothetical protein